MWRARGGRRIPRRSIKQPDLFDFAYFEQNQTKSNYFGGRLHDIGEVDSKTTNSVSENTKGRACGVLVVVVGSREEVENNQIVRFGFF